MRGTYQLESIKEGISQDTDRMLVGLRGHSLPEEHKGRDMLGHKKEMSEQVALTL